MNELNLIVCQSKDNLCEKYEKVNNWWQFYCLKFKQQYLNIQYPRCVYFYFQIISFNNRVSWQLIGQITCHMTHQTDDCRNDLYYHNMSVRGNAINFTSTEMHKTAYYNPSQNFPHYFPGDSGYTYEPPFGHTTPSPTGGDYYPHGSCAIQNEYIPTGGSDYKNPQCNEDYNNFCYQNQNIPPGNSPVNHSSSKPGKIFPWMTESRQNSKRQQNHQQQPQQQTTPSSQPARDQQTTPANSQTLSGKFSFSFDYDDKWPIKPTKKSSTSNF